MSASSSERKRNVTDQATQAVADTILGAYKTRTPVKPVRDFLPPGAIDEAYAAQEINTRRWLSAGRRLVGRKIGLTSLAVQRQLGVSQPDYGMLFDDMAVPDGWDVPARPADPAQGRGGDRLRHRARPRPRSSDHRRRSAGGRIRTAGDRDRRFAHRRLEDRHSRHDRRQRLLRPLCARREPEEARRPRVAPVRHGDGDGRRGSLGRRRGGLSRRPPVGDAVARQDHGEGRTALESGRHGDVGRARADGDGQEGRSVRSAHFGPRLRPRGLCEG